MFIQFFFFQAEDGIRDGTVTGVQTCALPISFEQARAQHGHRLGAVLDLGALVGAAHNEAGGLVLDLHGGIGGVDALADRKSTRLNSSHSSISYAVFCLKKKKKKKKIKKKIT